MEQENLLISLGELWRDALKSSNWCKNFIAKILSRRVSYSKKWYLKSYEGWIIFLKGEKKLISNLIVSNLGNSE